MIDMWVLVIGSIGLLLAIQRKGRLNQIHKCYELQEARREGAQKALEWAEKYVGDWGWRGLDYTLDTAIDTALGEEVDGD